MSSPGATASPTASSTVAVPGGVQLTDQGSKLSFGDTGTVIYEPAEGKGTVLQLTVKGVRKGSLADFKGFILDDSYKQKASYYYATVQVKNVGEGDVGGVGVPLWGVNAANTLLPAVNFTTSFKPCPSKPLPEKFAHRRDAEHLPGLPLARPRHAGGGELPTEPGVQPDHLDRGHRHPEADADAEDQGQEEGLSRRGF